MVFGRRLETMPMESSGDGWFELVTTEAMAGSRYKFQIDGGIRVPDPASRYQPQDVHGVSEVIDPRGFSWSQADWKGRPWEEAARSMNCMLGLSLPPAFFLVCRNVSTIWSTLA